MRREKIVKALKEELDQRNEWYGLDNWPLAEVVDFVADRLFLSPGYVPKGLRHTDDPEGGKS